MRASTTVLCIFDLMVVAVITLSNEGFYNWCPWQNCWWGAVITLSNEGFYNEIDSLSGSKLL